MEQTIDTSAKDIDQAHTKRLAFAKHLYLLAESSYKLPPPNKFVSLLNLHDAVELFLCTACDYLAANTKSKIQFEEYFDSINKKLEPKQLELRLAMQRMNKARVALKHHMTFPSNDDLNEFIVNTKEFLTTNTKLVFERSLEEVSLMEFVSPEIVRLHLNNAIEHNTKGLTKEALAEIAKAWKELLFFHTTLMQTHGFMQKRSFRFRYGSNVDSEIEKFSNYTVESISDLSDSLKLIALGIDYRKYLRLVHGLPIANQSEGGQWYITFIGNLSNFSKEDIQWKINFLSETAIALSDFN